MEEEKESMSLSPRSQMPTNPVSVCKMMSVPRFTFGLMSQTIVSGSI